MKLATLKNGERDGSLVVVSRDLSKCQFVPGIAKTMQQALDKWEVVAHELEQVYAQLNTGNAIEALPFDPMLCHSPLPRAFQWVDGSGYVNHVELVRKARGAEMPKEFWVEPLMYQGGSDSFIGPTDPILAADEGWGIDFEAEIAVITGDVPLGSSVDQAGRHIRLLMLVNDVSLRNLIPLELAKGFGFVQSKPATSFSPVAITPDELGHAWRDGKVHLPLVIHHNDKLFGQPNAGVDMTFNFARMIAHVAKTRELGAGSIVGAGTVSNVDRSTGSGCIAERRCLEVIAQGKATTPFMQFGDQIRIEMFDGNNESVFGAIDQVVEKYSFP